MQHNLHSPLLLVLLRKKSCSLPRGERVGEQQILGWLMFPLTRSPFKFLRLVPLCAHFGQLAIFRLSPALFQLSFDISKPPCEFLVCGAKGRLWINPQMPCHIGQRKQRIAEFPRLISIRGGAEFGYFFGDFILTLSTMANQSPVWRLCLAVLTLG